MSNNELFNIQYSLIFNYSIMKTNKFIYLFALLVTLSFGFIACNNETKESEDSNEVTESVKHYRHILFSETAFDNVKGIRELTAEEAKTVNNYKFTFDDKKRPVTIEFCRGEVILGYSSTGAAKITIEYTDSTETRLYFDKDGKAKVVNGEVFKSVFSLNETGMRTGLKFYDKEGNQIENHNKIASYTWAKLPNDMIKENRFNLAGDEVVMNEFCPFYELRFSYDDQGVVKRMANYEADTLYNCTAENCGDIGVSYFTFDINEHGDLQKFTVLNTVGQLSNLYWGWAKFENKIDEYGNTTEIAFWDQDDEYLAGKSIPVRQYKYDEYGAKIEETLMDGERNIINHPKNGFAIVEYNYNDQGHPTDTIRYDKDRVKL